MNFIRKILITSVVLFGLQLILCNSVSAQDANLRINFSGNLPSSVQVGSYFAIQGIVEVNGTNVPAGETVVATIEFRDPDGLIIDSHTQTWNGFPEQGNPGNLDNDTTVTNQVLFQVPWSEAAKWGLTEEWQVVARVTGAALENDLSDNAVTHNFTLEIPNLLMSDANVTGNIFLPNGDVVVSATVTNQSSVQTQNGVFFPVEARLFEGRITAATGPIDRNILDRERLIIPFADQGITPTLLPNDSISLNLPPLRLPADADGNYTIQVIVDPSDMQPLGSIVAESEEDTDNHLLINFSITQGVPTLQVNPNSFTGEVGTFRGLEPVRIGFTVRNNSNFAIETNDNYTARVVLSLNDTFNTEDFILREFDLGGDALGAQLLPNETVQLDWIQQMPDNLEGDYYLLLHIEETGQVFPLQNTPVINLNSKNEGQIKIADYDENSSSTDLINQILDLREQISVFQDVSVRWGGNTSGEQNALQTQIDALVIELGYAIKTPARDRPRTSSDGRWLVYETNDYQGFQQVFLVNVFAQRNTNQNAILVSRSQFDPNVGGNSHSLRPRISGDGSFVVFHSRADNLVAGDNNDVEDIFVYSVLDNRVFRLTNPVTGEEGNGASYYPDVNQDGSVITFESRASNLSTGTPFSNGNRQIHLWSRNLSSSDNIRLVTTGNANNHLPSVSQDGRFITFASDASDLLAVPSDDNNSLRDIFVFDADSNATERVNLTQAGEQTIDGTSDQPVISGDGNYIAFRSEATNMVLQGGIAQVVVESGGVGYFGNPTLEIKDLMGIGEGALIEIKENGINDYGQIRPDGIEVILAGKNYQSPQITIKADPNFPPLQTANCKPYLVNKGGEVYRVQNPHLNTGTLSSWVRVSESSDGIGGNMPSREPAISDDGSLVVYTTQASNLLESNVTREDGRTYFNRPVRQAQARAILVGGIGEIEVNNAGSGYQNGFLQIDDLSGLGSGASASYTVDSFGRISSITIVNPGTNYNLQTTVIGVDNPRGGSGFVAGDIRFAKENGQGENRTGGGRVHQITITDHGMGYQFAVDNIESLNSLLLIDGDGVDTDLDGRADAQINTENIHVDPQTGSIYLKQTFSIRVLSKTSLPGTTLLISDANDSVTITFSNTTSASSPPNSIATAGLSLAAIRNAITDIIENTWNSNGSISRGPLVEDNATGGDSFSLTALSGEVTVSNPSSVEVIAESNMLFSGTGFTRASPVFAAPPVILGFSEVTSGTTTVGLSNGRNILGYSEDKETDDIYLYEETNGQTKRERISRSSFGFPVNYRPSTLTSMPSNRLPAISGNGRHIYFSSDASDEGGLVFDNTNQRPQDNNNGRDIYYFDRKTSVLPTPILTINLLFPNNSLSHSFSPNSQIPIVAQVNYSGNDLDRLELLVDGNSSLVLEEFSPNIGTNRFSGVHLTPQRGTHTYQVVAFNAANLTIGASIPVEVFIDDSTNSLPPVVGLDDLIFNSATNGSSIPVSITGTDEDDALVGVQYYVDGVPFGDEILRDGRNSAQLNTFASSLNFSNTGVKSVFAIGRDSSGNYVSSEVESISVTEGSSNLSVSLIDGPSSINLASPNVEITLSGNGNGAIVGLNPLFVEQKFLGSAEVVVIGVGTGAVVEAVIEDGNLTGFSVISGGSGYDQNNTSLKIIPVIRAIGNGTQAEIQLLTNFGGGQTINLVSNIDGSFRQGSGYTVSPALITPPFRFVLFNGQSYERLPLDGNSRVAPFEIGPTGNNIFTANPFLVGGFSESPIPLSFSVSSPEELESLTLVVDGREIGVVTDEPFTFSWIPDEAKVYTIYAAARDFSGNVVMSLPNYVKVDSFSGGGISASFNSDSNSTAAIANSTIYVSGEAYSEFGIAEIEFFIDGISMGKTFPTNGSNNFGAHIDLTGIASGQHTISMIARDYAGNQAGTFDRELTNSSGKMSQNLLIFPSSSNISGNPVIIKYPLSGSASPFSSQSFIPIIADLNVSSEVTGLTYASVIFNGVKIGDMNQHPVQNSLAPRNSEYLSHRFTFSIGPDFTSVGAHKIQVVMFNSGTQTPVAMSEILEINISDFAQLSPSISLSDLPFENITTTSSLVFSARSADLDGAFGGLQFFLDGKSLGSTLHRSPGLSQEESVYLYHYEANKSGVYTVHAEGYDKVGNRVASVPRSFMVTNGTPPSTVDIPRDLISFKLEEPTISFIEDAGVIKSIQLQSDLDHTFFAAPSAKLSGDGTGAIISATLDVNGKLEGFVVDDGGENYSRDSLSLQLLQVRRVVRTGTPAEITTRWWDAPWRLWVPEEIIVPYLQAQEADTAAQLQAAQDQNDSGVNNLFGSAFNIYASLGITSNTTTFYSTKRRFDGTSFAGEGYVIAPRFYPVFDTTVNQGVVSLDRLPLEETLNGTSRVADINFEQEGIHHKGILSGGFTRAPIYLTAKASSNKENIEYVALVQDGVIVDTDYQEPYTFPLIADNPKDYQVSFAVKDFDGNIFFSDPSTLNVDEYYGSGIISSFSGDIFSTMQIGSDSMFSVLATSEYGISEVEFYIDGVSAGFAEDFGNGRYSFVADFKGYTQGDHLLGYVARDNRGNESGTHHPSLTNLNEFKHKTITLVGSSEKQPPSIFPIPTADANSTTVVKFKRGDVSTINLTASADSAGNPFRVFLFSNGEMLESTNGNFYVEFDENSTLHQNGIFSFEFIPRFEGNYTLLPMVIDSFGVQKFSPDTIHMIVSETSTASPSVSMVYPSSDITISSFSSTRFVATANHDDGSLLGVQFYLNGKKHGEFLSYEKDKPKNSSFYTLDFKPPYTNDINFVTASAIDTSGNETFSPAIVVKISQGDDNIPIINLDPVNESYSEEQSLFLSATVSDFSDSISGRGVVEEVSFVINGVIEQTFTQKPYFWIWDPMESGAYNIFVTARDNEGNVAVSQVEKTLVGFDSYDNIQEPTLGSIFPNVTGEVQFYDEGPIETSASQRRNSSNNQIERYTVIKGLSTLFLDQLSSGQIIRFSNGKEVTSQNYEVFSITHNDELQLKGLLSDIDKILLSNWTDLQIVNVYRAGSLIPLNLKSNVNDDEFAVVSFYVNAILLQRDTTWPFSSSFEPTSDGNYTIAVIAENFNGVQTLYTERLEVLPKIGLLPDGSTTIHPNLTRRGSTTIGSELVFSANYDDPDGDMNRVEFYLNGRLAFIDREKPYYFKFKPYSDATITQVDREWEVLAVGVDNDQNRIALQENGTVQSSVLLPEATIKVPVNNAEYAHEQSIKIRIDVRGSNLESLLGRNSGIANPNTNLTPRQMNVLANGELVTVAQETAWGSGIFLADWVCDQNLAGESGEIEVLGSIVLEDNMVSGSPFTPVVLSDIVKIKVVEPNLGGDPKAVVNQTIKDLLGKSATEQEVNLAITEDMNNQSEYLFENDDFLRWASHLSDREIFQNMVDAIAGHHIMIGQFPDYLKIREIMDTYSAIPNYGQDGSQDIDGDGFSLRQENLFLTSDQDAADFPSSAFSMGSFVDDMLSSSEFTDIHGEVPVLTPPSGGADRFTNYEKNRRDFVRIIYTNKYGTSPTIQQETQGSYRISVFDPESKEAQQANQLMMMQQLAMYSNFGVGGVGGQGGGGGNVNPFASLLGNTNTQNPQQTAPTFRNGEPAVLFVVNMIAEESINNLDMIWGASSKRDYYKTAALISSLWQENLGVMSEDLISQYHGLSTESLISTLMSDSRYLSRFGGLSISRDAQEVESAPGWKYLDWLGHFNDEKFPWIYHSGLGWVYIHGPKQGEAWFYIPSIGWLWTNEEVWKNRNPDWLLWFYEQEKSRWVGYYTYEPLGKKLLLDGKTFWDPQTKSDFTYE